MSEIIPEMQARVRALVSAGFQLTVRADYARATEALEAAAELAEEHGYRDEEMNARITLGAVTMQAGEPAPARECFVRALELARDLGDTNAEAKCLLNLGTLSHEWNPEEALARYREALALFEAAGDDLGTAQCLDNIGEVYRHVGSLRTAASYIFRANAHFRRVGDPTALATHCVLAGHVLTDIAQRGPEDPVQTNRDGRAYYERAAAIFRQLSAESPLASCLDFLGLAWSAEERCEEAIPLHREAARLFDQHGPASGASRALLHLGVAYARCGREDEAAEVFARVRELRLGEGDARGAATASNNLGVILNGRGDFAEAARVLRHAANIRDHWARDAADPLLRREMRNEAHGTWLEYLYALARQAEEEGAEDARAAFFRAVEESRSRNVPLSAGASSVEDTASLDEEIGLRAALRDSVQGRTSLRITLGRLPQNELDARMARLVSAGTEARLRLEALLASRHAAAADPLPPTDSRELVAELSARAGGRPCAVLYLLAVPTRSGVIVGMVTGGEWRVTVCEMVTAEREMFDRWVAAAVAPELPAADEWEALLSEMSVRLGALLEQAGVAEALEPGTLLILVPDGRLHLYPWEIAAVGSGHLGIAHAPVRAAGATDLLHQLRSRPEPGAAGGRSARLFCPECAPPSPLVDPDEMEDPEAEELLRVREILEESGFRSRLVAGAAASPEALLAALGDPEVRVLHFAGHGVFDPEDPSLSTLWMHADPASRHPDGALTALEIERRARMPGRPLVFLNSCQSAVAEVGAGDDFLGLIRAFLSAGAGALVVSGWAVYRSSAPDAAAAAYAALADGLCVADALRAARAAVRQAADSGAFLEPGHFAHWGPYCVYGDPLWTCAERHVPFDVQTWT